MCVCGGGGGSLFVFTLLDILSSNCLVYFQGYESHCAFVCQLFGVFPGVQITLCVCVCCISRGTNRTVRLWPLKAPWHVQLMLSGRWFGSLAPRLSSC